MYMYDFELVFPHSVTSPLTLSVLSLTQHILRRISMAHAGLFLGRESGPRCSHDAAARPLDPRRSIAVKYWRNPTNKFRRVSAHTFSWRPCTCRRLFPTAAASEQGAARRANPWRGSLFILGFGCRLPRKALCADLRTSFSFAVHFVFHSSPEQCVVHELLKRANRCRRPVCSSPTLETSKSRRRPVCSSRTCDTSKSLPQACV